MRKRSAVDIHRAFASTAAKEVTSQVAAGTSLEAADRSLAVVGIVQVVAGISLERVVHTVTEEAARTTTEEAVRTTATEEAVRTATIAVEVDRTAVVATHITIAIEEGIVPVVVSTKLGADQAEHTELAESAVRTTAGAASVVDTALERSAAE